MLDIHYYEAGGSIDEIEAALRDQEKVLEELELDRINREREEREMAIETMRGDIEAVLREEFEKRLSQALTSGTVSQLVTLNGILASEAEKNKNDSLDRDENHAIVNGTFHDDEESQEAPSIADHLAESAGSSGNFAA